MKQLENQRDRNNINASPCTSQQSASLNCTSQVSRNNLQPGPSSQIQHSLNEAKPVSSFVSLSTTSSTIANAKNRSSLPNFAQGGADSISSPPFSSSASSSSDEAANNDEIQENATSSSSSSNETDMKHQNRSLNLSTSSSSSSSSLSNQVVQTMPETNPQRQVSSSCKVNDPAEQRSKSLDRVKCLNSSKASSKSALSTSNPYLAKRQTSIIMEHPFNETRQSHSTVGPVLGSIKTGK